MKAYVFAAVAVMLVGCGDGMSDQDRQIKADQRKYQELTAGAATPAATDNGETIATAINLSGNLCARVVSSTPLTVGGGKVFEVTCVEYRGGTGTVRYTVDTRTDPVSIVQQ